MNYKTAGILLQSNRRSFQVFSCFRYLCSTLRLQDRRILIRLIYGVKFRFGTLKPYYYVVVDEDLLSRRRRVAALQ